MAGFQQVRVARELRVGRSDAPVNLATSGQMACSVYATSARTSGDQMAGYFEYHLAGAGGEGQAIRAVLNIADVTAGGSEEAIYAIVACNTSGKPSGCLSAVRGMITLPASTLSGTMQPLVSEVSVPANCDLPTESGVSFIRCAAAGTNVANFRLRGAFMHITGVGAASSATNFFHTTGDVDGTHGLRVMIDNVPYDILLRASTYA